MIGFRPVVPFAGLSGFAFLERTMVRQTEAFNRAPELARESAHFRERIGAIASAEALVADRRLLAVALGAFGLQDDIDNRFFIRRVLEDGSQARDGLANRLSDKRYRAFAESFGFGDPGGARTAEAGFAERIVSAFQTRRFEIAVGESDASLRLALNARRELPDIAARASSDTTLWLEILGTPPLRDVFETAFGLPKGFGALDLDRQVEVVRDRSLRAFGSSAVAQFADPERLEALTRRFLLRAQAEAGPGPGTPGLVALGLLRGGGGASPATLFAARV
ncbi:MAG: hypothetical protein CVT80_04685 [Alphaproteobacteria bacterium HGW-Alphaproteobacteria-2]|nr:MAG: hypothetical protein CVT80_04685 [Alphaproteobacteria bacterium HGW-Alphaproteobacteria-2]